MLQPWMLPQDLAPGDAKALERDWSELELHQINRAADPWFPMAYEALWMEFGAKGEMETREVLGRRFAWNPALPEHGCALLYQMFLVTAAGQFVAVRDCTAIVPVHRLAEGAVVHMSHVLVSPEWRRSGVAAWMRALPIQAARSCLVSAGGNSGAPITLVGEMEHPDPTREDTMIRLKAYAKAGFKKVDPCIEYWQPDFRPPEEIDASGGIRPVPLTLIIRRVGREAEPFITGSEVKHVIRALYQMYAAGFREQDMRPLFDRVDAMNFPETLQLMDPSES